MENQLGHRLGHRRGGPEATTGRHVDRPAASSEVFVVQSAPLRSRLQILRGPPRRALARSGCLRFHPAAAVHTCACTRLVPPPSLASVPSGVGVRAASSRRPPCLLACLSPVEPHAAPRLSTCGLSVRGSKQAIARVSSIDWDPLEACFGSGPLLLIFVKIPCIPGRGIQPFEVGRHPCTLVHIRDLAL